MSTLGVTRVYGRRAFISLLATILIATAFTGFAQSFSIQQLLTVDNFTFGTVGFGRGRISGGQNLYNKILRSPTALEDFRYVWKHGNAQARAYALTAFWKLDRSEFERDAAEFIHENPTVNSQHVDMTGRMPASWVVEGIRNGVPSYRRGPLPSPDPKARP